MPDTPDAANQPTVRSVERALDILEMLERSDGPLRLVDLSRGTELHAATVLRLVGVLQRRGFVQHDDTGEYRLGVAGLGMAHRYLQSDPLVVRSRPHLQELARTTGLTASLYARSGESRVLAARVDGRDPLRYQLPLGRRLPLLVGAGRTMLAFLPDDERERVLEHANEFRTAGGEVVTPELLRASVDGIRAAGFHISVSERDVGVAAVSVPVLDRERGVVAAVSVLGPDESTTTEMLRGWAPELRRAAHAIALSL
ncbi:IclR family transcriptional regulator [Microbacterium sp. SGAir0570]|uniref:IclR family transcriptional regulator n=1 Tax=Microbacterium sp. SGAir0570 TaxID=2070348 RepID=UPI0010CCEBD2|nr:IclR family transcriptional regulator [Microbacterium sp. SGAir0570]QCR39258.1 IclR family transcriptional regulator [Microbacterium sp. SGAir0570]